MGHHQAWDDITDVLCLIGVHALKGNANTFTISSDQISCQFCTVRASGIMGISANVPKENVGVPIANETESSQKESGRMMLSTVNFLTRCG
jgi:hypothetical protein